MARSKQVARDRNLPAAADRDAPERAGGADRRRAGGLPGVEGPLGAGGLRRAAGAAGNDFAANLVGGRKSGGQDRGGIQINADISGAGPSVQVSGGAQIGGVQLSGSLRLGGERGNAERGAAGRGADRAGAGGRGAEARAADSGGDRGPGFGGGGGPAGGGASGGGAGRGGAARTPGAGGAGGGGEPGGGDETVTLGGFQARTAGGGGAPASGAPGGGGGSAGGAGNGAAGGGGISVRGNGFSLNVSASGADISTSVGGVDVSASVSGSGVAVTATGGGGAGAGAAPGGGSGGGDAGGTAVGGTGVQAGAISVDRAAPVVASGAETAGRTTGAGGAGRTGGAGSSGNAAGGARAPRGGGGGASAGGGGGGGGGRAAAAPVQVGNTDSAQGAMNDFLGATPTTQVKMWTNLGSAVDTGIKKDGEAIQEAVPELHATMGGGGAQPEADDRETEVKTGQAKIDDKKVSPDAPRVKAPPTVVPAAPKVDGAKAMAGVNADTPVEQKQQRALETIRAIPTNMDGIPTSPGPAPKVPLAGDSDPAKADANRVDAEDQARKGGEDLRAAVEAGRGPDAVQPLVFDEVAEVRDLTDIAAEPTSALDPLDKYMQYGVPADVEGAIDETQQAVMDTALSEARSKVDEAVTTRDTDSQAEIEAANSEAEQLRAKADADQDAAVSKARGEISDARTDTLAQQEAAVAQLESEAGSRHRQEVDAIYARVAQDEAKIDSAYTKAESDVQKKIQEGEKDAEAEKRKAEEEANNRSWWDRVKDAVASAFKALTDAINAILTWVRDAVKGILDAVKQLATQLIDAACKWITDKIKAFGEWLKSQVNELLAKTFPGLAKALNELIDSAVDAAVSAVEGFAEELKGAINELCDKIAGALDAVLAAYQAAVNFALALAEAALTGNWAKVGQIVLEGILKLAGIDPEEFYAVIGKAEDTIDKIISDPGGFVGNVIGAVGQGFGQFSDNFLDHLQSGLVSWLTGTMSEAGIQWSGPLDFGGVLQLALEVMGINAEYVREKAVKHLGEKNTGRIEKAWEYMESVFTGGLGGLIEQIQGDLGGFMDEVINGVQDWLLERVVKAAVTKIASMFTPVGAIVQAVMTAWKVYEFLRDQIQRIYGVVRAVVDSISDIANGNIQSAADMVENALGQLVPVAIDLLAKLLGLSGLGAKLKEVVQGLRKKVDDAIEKMIERVKGLFKGGKGDDTSAKPSDQQGADPAADPNAPPAAEDPAKSAGPAGSFQFESGKLLGRDPTLGAVSYTITGSGRVKPSQGDSVTDAQLGAAKADALQAATSAVGKAVNAAGVTQIAGQLGALSDQAKASAGRGISSQGMSLESLTITGVTLPPEVQRALDSSSAQAATGVGLGEPLSFQAGSETHRVWVAPDGGGVAVMMASIPTKVSDKVEEIRAAVKDLPKEDKQRIGGLLGRAIAIERQLDKLGKEARAAAAPAAGGPTTGTPTAGRGKDYPALINAKQAELAPAIADLLLAMPAEASRAAFDMEMSLKGENYAKFWSQYQQVYADMGKSASAADAQQIWRMVATTLVGTTEDFNKLRPDGKNIQWDLDEKILNKVLDQFQPIVDKLTPAMQELSSKKGSTWAFWSGAPGKDAAVQNSLNALEASALGQAFDGIDMDGKWAMQLWGAMSRAYATFAAEAYSSRTFVGFLGRAPRDQSIVMKIEQPTFGKVAKAKPAITFYSAASLPWDREKADVDLVGGMKATYGAGGADMKVAGDTAHTQNEARAAAFKRLLDAGWTQADAEKASRGKSAADIDAAAASRAGGSVVRDAQVVANPPTEVTPGADRLRTPVGGVGDGSVENRRASVNGVNGDTEEQQLQPVGLPPGQNRGPALAAGQGDGRREVQDASSLSVGDQDASKEKKVAGKTEVSKYAVKDAPAGWRDRVVKSVPSETVNADDPGHTYHILDNGDVVSESRPKLVDASTADRTRRRTGFTVQAKRKTPEDTLRASGEMSSEEVDAMKGALKKNPRSEEVIQGDGTKKAVAKPERTDAVSGKKLTDAMSSDGTMRVPMTDKEKDALLKGHAILARDNVVDADMRKVIPNNQVGGMLGGVPAPGAEKLGPSVRGSVGLARNTEGMNAEETISALGLDYEHNPSVDAKPAAGKKTKGKGGNFTEMDSAGRVTMSDEVERDGLHYVDFKMTPEMAQHAGVAMSQDLIDRAKGSRDTEIAALGGKAHAQEKSRRDDPFAATGSTSSNAMTQKAGAQAGQEFQPVLNQELNLNPKKKAAGPGEAGFELDAGAQIKRRGNRAGQDKVIATLVEKADKDGKIVKEWELDAGLERNERGHYKNKMDHARSEAAAKVRKPGETDAEYQARMESRTAKIAAQRAKDEAEAAANGNPFEPGTPEFKSYNRKARQKAKAKPEAPPAPAAGPVAAGESTPDATVSASSEPAGMRAASGEKATKPEKKPAAKGAAADSETASTAAVEDASRRDAKSPAEEVEKILAPAQKPKAPKESKPPKDFPEPANDTSQGTTTGGPTVAPAGTDTRKVAANPGLRKEHEGTGVEYTAFSGEAFVKGDGDASDIDPNDVKQGSLGDCYLLGGMAAVSRANPEYIRKLIKDNGDGTYDVTLYIKNNAWDSKGTAKVVTVDNKFPSGDKGLSAKYAKAGDKGAKGPELWAMLIEKAWAVHKGTYTGIEGGKVNDDGKFAGAIAMLTNLREGYYTPASIGDKQLAQMISDALTQKKPVACDSKNLDKEPPDLKAAADAAGVVGNHAYAPRSVDLAAMTIELQNPWGSSHVSGLSIADFKRFYRGLRIGS